MQCVASPSSCLYVVLRACRRGYVTVSGCRCHSFVQHGCSSFSMIGGGCKWLYSIAGASSRLLVLVGAGWCMKWSLVVLCGCRCMLVVARGDCWG